jgi:ATP-dependent Lon protease
MSEIEKIKSSKNDSVNIPDTLPLLPVRDIIIYPSMVLPLSIGRNKSVKALEEAMSMSRLIFIVTQKNIQVEEPTPNDIYNVGTVCEILQILKMPDNTLKALLEGINRAQWTDFKLNDKGYIEVGLKIFNEKIEHTAEIEAIMRHSISLFEQYIKLNPRMPIELSVSVGTIDDPVKLADTIASHLVIKNTDKQIILELVNPIKRLEKIIQILDKEIEILNIEKRIQSRVRNQIEKTQKEYYLTEQLKAIQKELKQKDDVQKDIDELLTKFATKDIPKNVQDIAVKEIKRLEKMMLISPEATVIRTYLDWLLELPWLKSTNDNLDIRKTEKMLNQDHYGLHKVKDRVLEYLAVLSRVNKIRGPILCFIGPPGVGKTSIAKSIARSLGRKFVRISMGGIKDESEMRGHRRTYIGAMPGKIIQSIRRVQTNNPVFLLDEIDKIGLDWRSDPSAALLEILDPEQNYAFNDHYIDLNFDLSNVIFIATANTLTTIPETLLDRLEFIRFSGYTDREKYFIAKNFIIPKQIKEHGLKSNELTISKHALQLIIENYTREAGVRNLTREIANLCRKVVMYFEKTKKSNAILITPKNINKYLGTAHYTREHVTDNDVGVVTGLAWTEFGGEVLTIEINKMKGKNSLVLTGKLGDVMKESAQAALTYVRSIAQKFNIKDSTFTETEFHIHVPEGAVPKDGPSAGIAIATALTSVCMNKPIKSKIAMTGEVTLRGRILGIGGLKEKILAAYREGITVVLCPISNNKDLIDIPKEITKKLHIITVSHMNEVIPLAIKL